MYIIFDYFELRIFCNYWLVFCKMNENPSRKTPDKTTIPDIDWLNSNLIQFSHSEIISGRLLVHCRSSIECDR